jgi:hypothetical protein
MRRRQRRRGIGVCGRGQVPLRDKENHDGKADGFPEQHVSGLDPDIWIAPSFFQ